MAVATRILSLNLGTHTVGLAEFHAQPNGGLVLNGYRLREILADPSNENARNAQITVALREMLGELGIKGGAVNYATAAQSVFARFVKLPAVEVHITNIHTRESFRHNSYISKAAKAVIAGFGIEGYALAITGLAGLLGAKQKG